MANAKLADYHIRGMTDVTGSPGATIVTQAVEHWGDGSIRFTADGRTYVLRDPMAMAILGRVLNITRLVT